MSTDNPFSDLNARVTPLDDLDKRARDDLDKKEDHRPQKGRLRTWVRAFFAIVLLILIALPILHWSGVATLWPQHEGLMETLTFQNRHGGKAVVHYHYRVAVEEARRVGELLLESDEFGGPSGADVMIERQDRVVVIAFFFEVPLWQRDTPNFQRALDELEPRYRTIRDRLSNDVFAGQLVTVELCEPLVNPKLNKVHRKVMRRF